MPLSDGLRKLVEAVESLDAAERRSGTLCEQCGQARSLAVSEGRASVVWYARELAATAKTAG